MKNFKKVISAVIALAMIVSSFTAVSASKFADVADTAKYAEAVEVLAALGIVEGTEAEGALVFQPEKEVARTEAVAMLVRALNMKDEAMSSTGTSQFADVNTQAAWAAGYVNVGVAQGFINGYDASTFGPLDNVTYAQLCKMLTCIAGYGEYADAKGGWPTGYTSIAGEIGLSKGIAASSTTALTKGQVAQMIYNTLTTPKLGVYLYAAAGNSYTQLDGINGADFATLLSEKFGGYVASITITDTPVSNTELDNDEVAFTVDKAAFWPEKTNKPVTAADTKVTKGKTIFAADVDVNNNNKQAGKAVFVTNEDDELVMVYFAADGKTETKELAADTYVPQDRLSASNQYASDNLKIKFGSSYYKLEKSVDIYVNGSLYTTQKIGTIIDDKDNDDPSDDEKTSAKDVRKVFDTIIGGAQGTVKLVKEGDANYYTAIFVDYYQIAKVSAVDVEEDEITVSLTSEKLALVKDYGEIVISNEAVEEGLTVVTVTKNGAEASLEDLKKGDIIAFAADFANIKNLEDPKSLTVVATDATAAGSVTKIDDEDGEYTIGGAVYKLLPKVKAPELKDSLVLTLDPFGRVFATETDGTSTKYAIALRVNSNRDEVTLLLADGTQKTYEPTSSVDLDAVYTDLEAAKADVKARIVEYSVKNSTGEISYIKFVGKDAEAVDGQYKSKTSKIDSYTIASTTAVIDATKVESETDARKAGSYSVYAADSFVDGTKYTGFAFKDGTFVPFVVLTGVGTTFGEGARFAVVQKKAAKHYTDDDEECDLVLALCDGKDEQELLFVKGKAAGLKAGDVFFYETNADGFIDTVYEINFAAPNFENVIKASLTQNDGESDEDFAARQNALVKEKLPEGTDGWTYDIWDDSYTIQLATGIITEVDDKSISFAKYDTKVTEIDTDKDLSKGAHDAGIVTYAFADDAVAYVYDADSEEYEEELKYQAKAASSIKASNFDKYEVEDKPGVFKAAKVLVDDKGNDDPSDDEYSYPLFDAANVGLALIVDGDVVAVYVIEK